MNASLIPNSLRHLSTEGRLLWPSTSMHIGGPANYIVELRTETDLEETVAWACAQNLPYLTLGSGTNVLFSDAGYPGIVILTHRLDRVTISDKTVTAQCGVGLSKLAHQLSTAGLSGLEWACGIPGTVGGAIVMNAGAFGGDIASVLTHVRILTTGGVSKLSVEQLALGYRTSVLLTGKLDGIILSATFSLHRDVPEHCLSREREIQGARRRTQPSGASCGSIFKNPEKGPSAGTLLDRAGCKGLRVGSAYVSDLHANFIINEGTSNAQDVMELICQMRVRVMDTHGVDLTPEVVIIE